MADSLRFPCRWAGVLLSCGLALPAQALAQATPAEQLAAAEREHGAQSAAVIAPLVALASATLRQGDVAAAERMLTRADRLLDQHADHDRSLRLAVLLLMSECRAASGQLADSNKLLYQALDLSRTTSTIGPLEQASVLDRLAANDGRRGQITRANNYTSDALELRRKHHGEGSLAYANALLNAADWYRFSSQFKRERDLEHESLAILERRLGADDPFLAVPLIRIATSYTAQHARAAEAEQALQRALGLKFTGSRDDVITRAEAVASLGDLRVVFGRPEDATNLYVAAWQAIAASPVLGAPAANAYFREPRQLYMPDLETIAHEGSVDLRYTVTHLGTTDAALLTGDDLAFTDSESLGGKSSVLNAAWRSIRQARYRPRVVDGVAVPTPDRTLSLEYCVDSIRAASKCSGRGASAVLQ